ncbi:response regulator transcription factor [Olivibacter sp. CPCC 100613]|uniref:response regulator transcription factor n=1 Tax=Olivibacter sp. CPCC 100613 TaxID=3079931 RepID=UPI002FF8DA66
MKATIGIVDDHALVLESLIMLINNLADFQVTMHATDGHDLLNKLRRQESYPDILLIDVLMPSMSGAELTSKIKFDYPDIKLVALSVLSDSISVLQMIRAGCCAYLTKNMNVLELNLALTEIWAKGYYNSFLTEKSVENIAFQIELTDREKEFLYLACSDLNYHEIAKRMFLSIKTIDGYRASLFAKFKVKSRTGLVLQAIRHKFVNIS